MKAYHGILERVGDGMWKEGMTKISVLKIGNTMLSSVGAEDRMYSFLDVGRDMTIYIHRFMLVGKIIIGVSQKDGDKICIRFQTILLYIFFISFTWLFAGLLLWVGLGAVVSFLTCTIPDQTNSLQNQVFESCLDNSMWIAGLITIGLYILFIFNLVKDYILVRSLTLLGR